MDGTLLEKLLDGAKAHGEASDPDHEVGDLQDVLRTCWKLLTTSQQQAVYDEHKELVDEWIPMGMQ